MNDKANVALEDGAEPVELGSVFTARRLLRWTAIVGGGILAVLACWQDPSYAQQSESGPAAPVTQGFRGALVSLAVAVVVGGTVVRRWRPAPVRRPAGPTRPAGLTRPAALTRPASRRGRGRR